jgi:hypothetical protein
LINSIVDILKIIKEEDLKKEFGEFERQVTEGLQPLTAKLQQQVLSSEVQQLELHMTYVESWRDRVCRYNALAQAFVEHVKSTHFNLPPSKNVGVFEKEAYQKQLLAGFIGLRSMMEEKIRSVDSRVNLCKKLLGIESDIANPGLRR